MVLFDSSFNNLLDENDAKKLTNFGENFGMVRNGEQLSVEHRKPIEIGDTVFYSMGNLRQNQNYKMSFEAKNFNIPGMEARLEDKYLGSASPINLSSITDYNFAISSDSNSKAKHRFMLVFYPGRLLPMSFTSTKAWQQNSNSILVEWQVANQQNTQGYEVQKSTDGCSFSKVGMHAAIQTSGADMTYRWQDIYPIKADNFYRIKSISTAGEVQYSKVVKLRIGLGGSGISIYPNPIKSRTIFLQLNDIAAGKYKVRLLNDLGQEQMTRTFGFDGGNCRQTIPISKLILNGNYTMEIMRNNKKVMSQTILIIND